VPEPQSAIIPEPSENALFLVLGVNDPSRNRNAVARALANVPANTRTVGAIDAKARLVSARRRRLGALGCFIAQAPHFLLTN